MGGRFDFDKLRIVRQAIREDVLQFGLPALVVFFIGLMFSADDGYEGFPATIMGLIENPDRVSTLSVPNIVGLLLLLVGFPILFIAPITLGRFYSSSLVIREEHKLITHGVYRLVRHPIYLGVLMVCIGLSTYAASLKGLLTMACLIPIFLNRIRLEEKLLIAEFGDSYRSYQQRTRKLIPFVY